LAANLRDTLGYDASRCWSLESPSKSEVEEFLKANFKSFRDLDVLTLFFSGHGGINNGHYYLCPRDYHPDLPSLTGLSISFIVRFAASADISLVNIVIDACQSGGAQLELTEALQRPVRTDEPSVSVSMLVACLTDQPAFAGNPFSLFTSKLLTFMEGAATTHSTREWLSLADIASPLASQMQSSGQDAMHVALNVLGPAPFCLNPLHNPATQQPHSRVLSPRSPLGKRVFDFKDTLYRIYADLDKSLDDRLALSTFSKIVDFSEPHQEDLALLIDHFSEWYFRRSAASGDWSTALRILGSMSVSALAIERPSEALAKSLASCVSSAMYHDLEFFEFKFSEWIEHTSGLNRNLTPFDNFHYFPIQISALYGRLGLIMLAQEAGLIWHENASEVVINATNILLERFPNAHVLINEAQALYMAPFFQGCSAMKLFNKGEEVLGQFLNDHAHYSGCCLDDSAKGETIWRYLKWRQSNETQKAFKDAASINTALPVFLYACKLLNSDDIADQCLAHFDRCETNIAIATSIPSFRELHMQKIINCNLTIGMDVHRSSEYFTYLLNLTEGEFPLGTQWTPENFYCAVAGHILGDRVALVDTSG
jgi:hypothetical protein